VLHGVDAGLAVSGVASVAAADDGSGNSYTVEVTVAVFVDTDTATTTAEETGSTDAAPAASIDAPTDDSTPRWDRYDVDWSASDADANLDSVVVESVDASGATLDSATTDVSGDSASGVRRRRDALEVDRLGDRRHRHHRRRRGRLRLAVDLTCSGPRRLPAAGDTLYFALER